MKRKYALMFDEKGTFEKKIRIKKDKFKYEKGKYVVYEEASNWINKGIIIHDEYYFYTKNNPKPYTLSNENKGLNAEEFDRILETNLIKKMHQQNFDPLQWIKDNKGIVFIGLIIVVLAFLGLDVL